MWRVGHRLESVSSLRPPGGGVGGWEDMDTAHGDGSGFCCHLTSACVVSSARNALPVSSSGYTRPKRPFRQKSQMICRQSRYMIPWAVAALDCYSVCCSSSCLNLKHLGNTNLHLSSLMLQVLAHSLSRRCTNSLICVGSVNQSDDDATHVYYSQSRFAFLLICLIA